MEDPELKQVNVIQAKSDMGDPLRRFLHYYSSFFRLRKAMAWVLRCKRCLQHRCGIRLHTDLPIKGPLTVQELDEATSQVIRLVQGEAFERELTQLASGLGGDDDSSGVCKSMSKLRMSSLRKLCPFIQDGVLRVGGRLQDSHVPYDAKHQIILPSKHHVTRLIIESYHVREGHCGTLHTLFALREKYWILRGHSTIRSVLRDCRRCRFLSAPPLNQIMAQLPEYRVTSYNYAFLNVGVDYAGPLFTRVGRSNVKRYVVLFTCLAGRAVHIEMAYSLETTSCLQAIQRFINRRGRPQTITSDNGTNFVGADRELKRGIQRWNQSVIHKSL